MDRILTIIAGMQVWTDKTKMKRGRDVKCLTRRLEELDGYSGSDDILSKLIYVKLQLNMDMEKKERYWEQQDRVNWLKIRDKNTSFFHNYASQRRRMN